jgi:hypothetical protein
MLPDIILLGQLLVLLLLLLLMHYSNYFEGRTLFILMS